MVPATGGGSTVNVKALESVTSPAEFITKKVHLSEVGVVVYSPVAAKLKVWVAPEFKVKVAAGGERLTKSEICENDSVALPA